MILLSTRGYGYVEPEVRGGTVAITAALNVNPPIETTVTLSPATVRILILVLNHMADEAEENERKG